MSAGKRSPQISDVVTWPVDLTLLQAICDTLITKVSSPLYENGYVIMKVIGGSRSSSFWVNGATVQGEN